MTGGFLLAIIAIVLAIVIAAPQYARPAIGAGVQPAAEDIASEITDDVEVAEVASTTIEQPTSKLPTRLRGYRWPVRGGMVARYYEAHPKGDFQIAGERMHDGLVITWFEGAIVKAAHKGTVVAAGRDWANHVGFDGTLDRVYRRYASIGDLKAAKQSGKPWFPQGIVVDDGNGYYSVYTEIKELLVKPGDTVKAGQSIGRMAKAEGMQMMRYRLVRMDGPPMRVHESARQQGYPFYARERVDPLAVLDTAAKRMPQLRRTLPSNPPRLSEY